MNTPIYEQLKAEHGFDPLEAAKPNFARFPRMDNETMAEYHAVLAHYAREMGEAWPNSAFPPYRVNYDHEAELWAVLKGQMVGDSFVIYQPCAHYPTQLLANNAAAIKNEMTRGIRG